MAVATSEDVAVALGRPISTSAEEEQIEWWLGGVERQIRRRFADLSELDQEDLRYVEAEAVAGKVRRAGTNESSITVAVDDGSVTRRWDNSVSADDITDEWWNLLNPNVGSAAFSARPYFEADTAPVFLDWS